MAAVDKPHVVVDMKEEDRRSSVTAICDSDLSEEENTYSSDSGIEIVDLECELSEVKIHLYKEERDCRICHLSLDGTNHESGIPIDLGCSCKDDLAAAHKHCAEAWFKIKGNKCFEVGRRLNRERRDLTDFAPTFYKATAISSGSK